MYLKAAFCFRQKPFKCNVDYRQGHDISHTDTLVAVHLRLAARLDTWLDSSLLCLSTPHMLWTRGENTLQGSGVHASKPNPNPAAFSPRSSRHCNSTASSIKILHLKGLNKIYEEKYLPMVFPM